jgi:hypothetical protein
MVKDFVVMAGDGASVRDHPARIRLRRARLSIRRMLAQYFPNHSRSTTVR